MGLNLYSLSRIAADAYRQGANFFLFGGDLVEGYTSEPDDFGFQFKGWKQAVSGCSKVAAMLTGHEHAYHRTLISNCTPVGLYPEDDTNNDGILARYSPNPEFLHPTWQITVGTAGAPYYTQEKAPWTPEIFSSQEGYVLVRADNKSISLKFISLTGQVVDCVDDLMEIKKQKR
ncbi:MAG: hypothetical protein ACLQPD_18235 [Desulfomonilaceae bacterium]